MIIGVDAGALSVSDDRLKVGVWRVSFELLKALSCIDTSKCYRLYSFAPIPQEVMGKLGSNMQNVVLAPSLGYMKFRLPLSLLKNSVDCFLGLSQMIPVMRTGKKIGFIYDLGFLQYPENYGSAVGKLIEQTAYAARHSDEVITISESSKEDIVKAYYIPQNRIHVCYPGVSSVFKKTGKKDIRPYPYVLYVGSLRKGKNIPGLISAFQQFLSLKTSPYHLILAGGDYWQDPDIQKKIEECHLIDRIHQVGHVSDEKLSMLYRGATALVTMTLSEGFCIPIIEAFASGCPVIASNIAPIAEIAGKSCHLIDPLDRKACANALSKLTSDPKLQMRLKKQGLERAKIYSWKLFAESVLKIIEG